MPWQTMTKVFIKRIQSIGGLRQLKDDAHSFLEASSIEVLPFIRASAHWFEALIWFLLIWVGVYLTCRDTAEVASSYINEETITDMKIRDGGKTLEIKSKICLDFDPAPLVESFASLWPDRLEGLFFELSVSDDNANISSDAIRLVYGLLLGRTERVALENDGKLQLHLNEEGSVNKHSYVARLDALQEFVVNKNISVDDVQNIVGKRLCKLWNIRVQRTKGQSKGPWINFCANVNTSWIGMIPFATTTESTVCYHFAKNAYFDDMRESTELMFELMGIYAVSGPPPPNEDKTSFPVTSYFDYSGDIVSSDLTFDWVQLPDPGQCMSISIGIGSECVMLNKRRQECSPAVETSFGSFQALACFARCTADSFVKRCGCFPVSWKSVHDDDEYREVPFCRSIFLRLEEFQRSCTDRVYGSNESLAEIEGCQKRCLGPCNFKFYSRLKNDRECEASGNQTTVVDFYPQNFIWAILSEQPKLNVYQLVSSLGGVLGLWLGIGIMGLLHALVSPLKIICIFLLRRVREISWKPTSSSVVAEPNEQLPKEANKVDYTGFESYKF